MSIQTRLRIWIARERNNLGKHREAATVLGSGINRDLRETPIGVAAAALRHESLFFDVDPREPKKLERVIKSAHGDLDRHSTNPRVATLLGNMLLVSEALKAKIPLSKTAKDYFEPVQSEDIWALLGLAQWHDLHENTQERTRLAVSLRERLASTSSQRREINTVLIRKAAETQCDVWSVKTPTPYDPDAFRLNPRLLIYSPVRKRYIERSVFDHDMNAIMSGQTTTSIIRS